MDESTQAIAEAQAAKDREFLEALKARPSAPIEEVVEAIDLTPPKMNRAQRRERVKLYAMVLAEAERQAPFVADTIIPRSARRRRKAGRK